MTAASGASAERQSLATRYAAVRRRSVELAAPLAPEDCVVQSMPDVSPTKWHLAHVTWFFEQFVLLPNVPGYRAFDDDFFFLFNSYYQSAGNMHARPERGLLSRPTLAEVMRYREHVDAAMLDACARGVPAEVESVVALGLEHECQHQELLLTDIKHVLSRNPLQPAMRDDLATAPNVTPASLSFTRFAGGITRIGMRTDDPTFCYDNETPQHPVLLQDYAIADRLVTNGEYRDFIRSGGYADPALWLSDGWATVCERGWQTPLYWDAEATTHFTLGGRQPIDDHAPVTHLSFYEADAFARWADARLPTEAEWEHAARSAPVRGNLLESDHWAPVAGTGPQWFGDTWEWTASAYAAYPGFRPLAGSLGEYNGKFMCNQMVVRGGSCVSAADHLRATYRSFFYPDARWQFLGLRLARDT